MGWKRKYGFPTTMVMEAVGIKSYTTYKQTLDEIVEWGFIEMVERSKNQYSSNIIALPFFDEAYVKAPDEALDKAMSKHASKQHQSIVSIDIPNNKETIEPKNKHTGYSPDFESAWNAYGQKGAKKEAFNVWRSLTDEERERVVGSIQSYFKANPEVKYRKDFERYMKTGKFEANFKLTPTAEPMSTREQFANYGDSI